MTKLTLRFQELEKFESLIYTRYFDLLSWISSYLLYQSMMQEA